jgi:hypothetical protein
MALLQIHHQYKDGTVSFVAQKDVKETGGALMNYLQEWVKELWERHPPPPGARFVICTEQSPLFIMAAKIFH